MTESKQMLSFYVPYIPEDFGLVEHEVGCIYELNRSTFKKIDRDEYARFFERELNMGKVKRIDFTSRVHPKTGQKITSAFLHFESLNDTAFTRHVCERIKTYGNAIVYGVPYPVYLQQDRPDEKWYADRCANTKWFQTSDYKPRHLILRENLSPIPDADCELNVHQLVAANKVLEFKLTEKDARIRELEALIETLRCFNKLNEPSTPTRTDILEPPPLPPKLKREGSTLYCFPPMDLDVQAEDLPPLQGEAVLHYDGKPVSLAKALFSD